MLSKSELLSYEIRSRWWTGILPISLMGLAGMYFAWLVRRKYRRYERNCEAIRRLQNKWLEG